MSAAEPLDETLAFVRRVARDAGAILAEGAFRGHAADHKRAVTDLVTEYDRRSEALIVAAIAARYPDDAILAEESGAHAGAHAANGRRWLIDPLDGTTNFAHGLPFFCVSIALEIAREPAVGVVEAPALGWSFAAARGFGARLNEKPIHVSLTERIGESLLATGFPYDNASSPRNNFAEWEALYKLSQGGRRVGAAALDLAMVAAGWLDGYWEMKLKPWDLAAGALLVREAGGAVTSWSGAPLDVDSGEALASNGRIHEQMTTALDAVRRR
ncbi:MAG TPA: inositol monophosphatase family protein [Polyangia bacterium]|nr:inositol monophosphatase family protein [Polyangia bacterium]